MHIGLISTEIIAPVILISYIVLTNDIKERNLMTSQYYVKHHGDTVRAMKTLDLVQ